MIRAQDGLWYAYGTQNAELHLANNTASVLWRPAPEGDYTVETKVRFAPTQAAQQAGLLLYENDDRYFKMAHSALPLQRGNGAVLQMSEFGEEGERPTTTPPIAVANGPMFGGPAAETMWLRLSYPYDAANRANEVRAATSRGERWVRNGVWTLPAKGPLKIGLVSMNRTGAVAAFDYVRLRTDVSRLRPEPPVASVTGGDSRSAKRVPSGASGVLDSRLVTSWEGSWGSWWGSTPAVRTS
ncbi:DUF1349 domain-containing protein [Nonomuraea sp. FMUSA5-5]|uniref:DUF1349 domain-containing protein n=2 Tax=Nonomuraea composti TaxID=2720023 RepID=A0ABX1BQD6_9ACTN|nr:DUF1349 domain-containing protein [Nonomuraea sp. FMUSA5-5]NJP97398.1 DUF1349 domain-containing protein [Nonomuraea sp. FMUSA5-5]